jgi:anaerobic selenocysteine-containing dehydrogenase
VDDEVVAAMMLERGRHSFEAVRREPYGILDDTLGPGWLIPGRLPHPLDVAPPELVGDLEAFAARTATASPPLVLVGRRISGRYNTLSLRPSTPSLWIHPADADGAGVVDGGRAIVATDTGAVEVVVEVTERIRPGVVSLPHGVGTANVNALTTEQAADRRNGMPVLSGFPVRVAPAAGAGAEPPAEAVTV